MSETADRAKDSKTADGLPAKQTAAAAANETPGKSNIPPSSAWNRNQQSAPNQNNGIGNLAYGNVNVNIKNVNNRKENGMEKNKNGETQTKSKHSHGKRPGNITLQNVSAAVHLATQAKIMEDVQNLEKRNRSPFLGNQKTGSQKIVGTNEDQQNVAAKQKQWLFISKYRTTVTEEDVIQHLKSKFPENEFLCEQIKNRQKTFNSFKVAVDMDLKEKLLDPSLWPRGIEVDNYLFRRSNYTRPTTGSTYPRGTNNRRTYYRGKY